MFKVFLYTFIAITQCTTIFALSDLDRIIAPEIKEDALYQIIYLLSRDEPIKTILEIGSSSGDGSTEAFVLGATQNSNHPTLFCMELSKPRFIALQNRYKNVPCVKCYNVSSVPLTDFPTENDIIVFLNKYPTNLNGYGYQEVLRWLRQDIEYVANAQVPQNGIEIIKKENDIEYFDMVLIDGSEFTGMAEFKLIYGARIIALDDINAFKNYMNYVSLLNDPQYELIHENHHLRNGYAVFKKRKQLRLITIPTM